jgi:hypothetical protein
VAGWRRVSRGWGRHERDLFAAVSAAGCVRLRDLAANRNEYSASHRAMLRLVADGRVKTGHRGYGLVVWIGSMTLAERMELLHPKWAKCRQLPTSEIVYTYKGATMGILGPE